AETCIRGRPGIADRPVEHGDGLIARRHFVASGGPHGQAPSGESVGCAQKRKSRGCQSKNDPLQRRLRDSSQAPFIRQNRIVETGRLRSSTQDALQSETPASRLAFRQKLLGALIADIAGCGWSAARQAHADQWNIARTEIPRWSECNACRLPPAKGARRVRQQQLPPCGGSPNVSCSEAADPQSSAENRPAR